MKEGADPSPCPLYIKTYYKSSMFFFWTSQKSNWVFLCVYKYKPNSIYGLLVVIILNRREIFPVLWVSLYAKVKTSEQTMIYIHLNGFRDLEVPKLAGSNPAEAVGFYQGEKILSTPSFGREVKPFVPCSISAACKRTRKCMRGSRSFRSKLPAISRPSSSSFHC